MNTIPWHDLMLLGMGGLRLAPEQFWNMTLAELMVLVKMQSTSEAPIMRSELDQLMQRFPD